MNTFIKTLFLFVLIKFDNLAKTDNFFPAFLQKEAMCSSKLKVPSICTPNSFCFLLSQIYAQTFSYLNPETSKRHLSDLGLIS